MSSHYAIIYHGDCFDGFTAAWVFWKHIDREANFYPAHYGTEPDYEKLKDKIIYILDFSYKKEIMEKLERQAIAISILDHHKTAEADLKDLNRERFNINFDMNRSGAGLAFDLLTGFKSRHWLVNAVEDRDLWKFERDGTREILAVLASTNMTFEEWDNISYKPPGSVIKEGEAILKYISMYSKKACEHVRKVTIAGYKDIPAINVSYMNGSDHLDYLQDFFSAPFVTGFFLNKFGRFQFSLRSRGDFDVSNVARTYGGGGHKNASGFQVSLGTFVNIIGM